MVRSISGRLNRRFPLKSSILIALLSVQREADGVRVQAADIGIEAGHLPTLFRRLYWTDNARSRETGGAGLGLVIAKSFAQAMAARSKSRARRTSAPRSRFYIPQLRSDRI